jgi:threonylcarbamoyladenosine tRNA methylthiotransferase MtaB
LRDLGESQMAAFLQRHVGHKRRIIVEKGGVGRTEHFAEVRLDKDYDVGSLMDIKTNGIDGLKLTAEVLN